MTGLSRRNFVGTAVATTAAAGLAAPQAAVADAPGAPPAYSGDHGVHVADDAWKRILADADMVWQKMPKTWYEGPFLGNALLGSGIYAEPGANAVLFNVQHSEVQDHRPEFGSLFGLARLPIGHFTLEPVGTITAINWQLGLYDAELTGTITTDQGTLTLRALVHNSRSVLAVEITPSAGESGFRWVFHPAEAISPRIASKEPPGSYTGNPPAQVGTEGPTSFAVQPLLSGGQHVTAWQETHRGARRTLYVTVAHSFPQNTARDRAVRTVRSAATHPYDALAPDHRAWWHRYYRKSLLSLPDARLQRFYWIQLYKVGSAARRDAPVMATSGPWLEPTPWPPPGGTSTSSSNTG